MSLIHYTSRSNEKLAEKLAENIRSNDSVFSPHFIITSHNATNDWLTSVVANENKISAHVFYKQPLQFIEMVYNVLEAGVFQKELINPNQMIWIIDAILDDGDFNKKEEHKKVSDYIGGNHLKRFALAEKITDLFHKYQETNPKIILKWNNDELTDKREDEIWQKFIWNKLVALTNSKLPDLTKIYESIKIALKDSEKETLLKAKIPFVTFYGTNNYTKDLLDLLEDLGNSIDVTIYRQVVLTENSTNHRLAENFGVVSNRQNELFSKIEAVPLAQAETVGASTLLEAIQNDVMGIPHAYKMSSTEEDDSLTISNCFSVNREVEALYHYLVKQFENNPTLMMRDVCVIVKDIELYAPAVTAFFSQKPFDIGFTFYDTSHRIHESPYLALHTLLNFDKDNFTSKQVMSLLDFSYIREKFGFQEDLNDLYRAVNLANIRHGMDGDKELETDYVSWRYGFKRLIYGSCLAPNSDELTFDGASFFPVDQFEDKQTLELLKLYEFTEVLFQWLETREKCRKLNDWGTFIDIDTIQVFLDMKDETNKLTRLISDMSAADEFRNENSVEYTTIRYFFNSKLENLEGGQKTGYGGVRFVSPNANLSSPAKIYAFLGMNGSDFPRRSNQLSFDLSNEDQITSTDLDKNLFLNIILSAQSKCYLSYIGQSIKDNSSIPPSTVIDELLASAEKYFNGTIKNADDFIIKHPLHPFSNKYNSKDLKNSLFQYSADTTEKQVWLKENNNQIREIKLLEEEDGKTIIQLNDLIRFLEDPIRYYYNKVLGIYYGDREVNLDEVEPFELDSLEVWSIKDLLLSEQMKGHDNFDDFRETLAKKGILPLRSFGEKIVAEAMEEVGGIVSGLESYSTQLSKEKNISIEVGDFIIKGHISSIYADTLLYATVSKTSLKRILQALVSYCVLKLDSPFIENLHYVSNDKRGQLNLDEDRIKSLLISWCELLKEGTRKMVYFSSAIDKPDKRSEINKFRDLNVASGFNAFLHNKINDQFSPAYFSEYFLKEFSKDAFVSIENSLQFIEIYNKIINDVSVLEEVLA